MGAIPASSSKRLTPMAPALCLGKRAGQGNQRALGAVLLGHSLVAGSGPSGWLLGQRQAGMLKASRREVLVLCGEEEESEELSCE